MRMTTFIIILTMGTLGAMTLQAQEPHPFNVHDLIAMDRISGQEVSPDGKRVVFVLRSTDLEANKGRTNLWLINMDGSNLSQLTSHEAGEISPVWGKQGRFIYFLSSRSGSMQIWKIPANGGEAVQISDLPLDVNMLKLSPDGGTFCISMDVFPGKSVQETADQLEQTKNAKVTGKLYTSLFIRHWDTWKDGRRAHLFVMPVVGGEPLDLMQHMDADCPTKPWGGAEEVTFTPDGKGLVFTAKGATGSETAWSTNDDLWFVSLSGEMNPKKLTDNPAWDTQPAFSHDGKTLAYLAMKRPGYESDRYLIVLRLWNGSSVGKETWLTEAWDHSAGSILWSEDDQEIFTTADFYGQRALFAVDIKSGAVRPVFKEGMVRSPQLTGKTLILGRDYLKSPVELYTLRTNGKDLKQITHINQKRLDAVLLGEPEQFTFKGWNDETVYAYVVKPAGFNPTLKYPVAFLIHGGPQGSFGNDFHYRWNPQTYAGAGYAAVMVDFHGSTGYGQAFCDAIRGDWGGKPLEDLQKGLAAALEKYPWMDGDRVAALGASYGGYMINWIAGNWPDRFRCLVNHDGNLDERFAYYDTEELWFPEWDHMGTPFNHPEHYEKQNPINFVQNWKTPMMVVHGEMDYRVAVTQGIATFNALQRRGIPSQFLYFPDENHWVLKPHNSILWHETVIAWLDKWCKDSY